jgi:putative CocE/NonD family hydrolase
MVPYASEFRAINIPVLTTTGYFDPDQRGAFYYYNQHRRWNKKAKHYLLVGPYDHLGARSVADPMVSGYSIDSAANISIMETVWQWFDHTLKDSALPVRLKDYFNYQVMGTNEWRSAPSADAIANDSLVLHLSTIFTRDGFRMLPKPQATKDYITQQVDYRDRELLQLAPVNYLDTALFVGDAVKFISQPLEKEVVMAGGLAGEIRLLINKKDIDLSIALFEQQPDGKYFLLSNSWQRSSYVRSPEKRTLLRPGVEERIPIYNSFMTAKKLSKGSRLVLLVGMNKSPQWEVNYGSGKDVSRESMEDGKEPLLIKWSNRSFIRLPVSH